MNQPSRIVVLSDLHIGPNNRMTSFREHTRLTKLIDQLTAGPPTELILAGDIFDFLQIDGYVGFDATLAATRVTDLVTHATNAPIFAALSRFVALPEHALTILSGNHDPELVLPEVRAALAAELKVPVSRLRFPDDETALLDANGWRPRLFGRRIGPPDDEVWVVHGDRWDPHNAIDRQDVAQRARDGQPVTLPIGSHVVFEALAETKPTHAWIDLLKPEVPAVLLVLMYLDPATTMRFVGRHRHIGASLLVGSVRGAIARVLRLSADPSGTPVVDELELSLARALADVLDDDDDRDALVRELGSALRDGYPLGEDTLASHGGLRRWLARAWLARIRASDRFQDEDAPDEVWTAAEATLPGSVRALVAGHTHGLRAQANVRREYYNSGTWIPVGQLRAGDMKEVVDEIEAAKLETPAPCTAVEIDTRTWPPVIHLRRCDEEGNLK